MFLMVIFQIYVFVSRPNAFKVAQVAAMEVDFTTDHTVFNCSILLKVSEKPNVHKKYGWVISPHFNPIM